MGELWAIAFDGERRQCVAVKRELPLDDCHFGAGALDVRIGDAALTSGGAVGDVTTSQHTIAWRLTVTGGGPPLLLLPSALYATGLPRAKSLVPRPLAGFDGTLTVDGEHVPVTSWVGSQNHNWGSRHTDSYAWGQVAGFDGHPETFLEVATAQLRVGPFWTPRMTPLVLRHAAREHRVNATGRTLRARAALSYFTWTFAVRNEDVAIEGRIEAPRWAVVGLRYRNPPGGEKHCLNTKIATCTLTLVDRSSGRSETLRTADRAAFEILTDDRRHGVPIAV